MISRFLYDARQELKRSDHLIYVSLKYTRTIDVMNNIIERLINTFDFIMNGILSKAKNDGKITSEIKIPGLKVEKVKELYKSDNELMNYLDFYLLLRKIAMSRQERSNEFRRGVTMTASVDNKLMEVTIDIITDYYKKVVEFYDYIQDDVDRFLEEEEED